MSRRPNLDDASESAKSLYDHNECCNLEPDEVDVHLSILAAYFEDRGYEKNNASTEIEYVDGKVFQSGSYQ